MVGDGNAVCRFARNKNEIPAFTLLNTRYTKSPRCNPKTDFLTMLHPGYYPDPSYDGDQSRRRSPFIQAQS
jgi:hypothetical protein